MKDAYYFSHDAGARNDPKILAMRSVYGAEGYGWYWMIIEMLREQRDYKYPITKYTSNALAMQMQCEPDAAHKFVDACINEFGLFESDGSYFWSESLIRRMEQWDSKRESRSEQARRAALVRWGKTGSDADSCDAYADAGADAMREHSGSNANHAKKGKESKGEDIDIDSANKDSDSRIDSDKADAIPYEEIVNLFHSLCPSLPKVQRLTDKRRKQIRARWKEYGNIDDFRRLFQMAETSDFLSGRNGRWDACNFDWLLKPSNMVKVLEGTYTQGKQRSGQDPSQRANADVPSWVDAELERLSRDGDKS